MSFDVNTDLPTLLRGRAGAVVILAGTLLGGLALLGQAAGGILDARSQIAESRDLLARTRAAADRPPLPAPLWGTDEAGLLAAFRARLDDLAGGRAILIDESRLDPDPDRPTAPRLSATLRGTTEGLHDLLLALETHESPDTRPPLTVIESANLRVLRPADAETGWPTVLQLSLSLRGALVATAPSHGNPGGAR